MVAGPNITKADSFSVGSHKDDVIRLQGLPSEVTFRGDREIWHFGSSNVTIDAFTELVKGWFNAKELKTKIVPGPNMTDSDFFTVGSHKDDVARLHGTPVVIADSSGFVVGGQSEYCWHYDSGTVCFTTNGLVNGWEMSSKGETALKAFLVPGTQTTSLDYFTLGSTKDDVIRLQGAPTLFRRHSGDYAYHEWNYGRSIVRFSAGDRVTGWENIDGNLKARTYVSK